MAYGYSNKDKSPCTECTERYPGCHSKCESYNDWLQAQREKKFKISQSINPTCCRYFKERNNSKIAAKSKKRYR